MTEDFETFVAVVADYDDDNDCGGGVWSSGEKKKNIVVDRDDSY